MTTEENIPAEPQAGDVGNPQPQAGTTATPEPQAGDGHETISLEEAKKLRSEASNLRKRLKAYEDQAAEAKRVAEEAQLSEIERFKKQHAEIQAKHDALQAEMQELRIQHAVERHASELKFHHPEIAIKLLDRSGLEYEDNGTPKNVKHLLKKLKEAMPELAQAPAPETPPPSTPAAPVAPALPAMNHGRSNIVAPGTTPPGKPMRLEDVVWSRQ